MRRFALLLLPLCWATTTFAQTAPTAAPEPRQAPAPVAPAPAAPAPAAPAPAPAPAAPATPAPADSAVPPAPAPTEAAASPDAGVAEESVEPAAEATPPAEPTTEGATVEGAGVLEPEPLVPSPGDLEARLTEQLPPPSDASLELTAPVPVLTLHGYMRMRGELMDSFFLGRRAMYDVLGSNMSIDGLAATTRERAAGPDPFTRFRPLERRVLNDGTGVAPGDLDCVDEDRAEGGTCDVSTLRFANLRLRLTPQLNISEDVRVKMTIDALDNTIAGEPAGTYYGSTALDSATNRPIREAMAEETFFAGTTVPGRDANMGPSIKVRRAWAEVRNRDLGELRFGRMPMHWGLGMLYNAGDELDDDRSTDLDRVLGTTKLAGLYLSASYDFIAEGVGAPDLSRPIDQSQLDDVDQLTFSVARRHSPEELSSALERGDLVLNGGLQLSIRNQDSQYVGMRGMNESVLETLEATSYTTDLWGLLRYRSFRAELEAAWVTGGMEDLGVATRGRELSINQLGYALETELRLLDDKLGIFFDHGLATGDDSVEGLSSDADYITQLDRDDTISTFRFHPSYRVDLIMWRNIMGQVTGAYYFKPGIGYDFLKSDFGELLGARLDFVWSRATSMVQTWGNSENLGVELNLSIYFRSEDGPELDDGFHAMAQYGVLFPMRGLGYNYEDTSLDAAQTLRLVLGVKF